MGRSLSHFTLDPASTRTGWIKAQVCVFLALFMLMAATQSFAQTLSGINETIEPGPGAMPEKISARIFVVDVLDIDSVSQTILVDFVITLRWSVPGLEGQFDSAPDFDRRNLWTPKVQIVGDMGLRQKMQYEVEIQPDGSIATVQRYVGRLSSRMNLKDFPLDRHKITIQAVIANRQEALVEALVGKSGQAATLTVADWNIGQGKAYTESYELLDDRFPSVVYEFEVRRAIGYYVWKVMLPLVLIICMSWVVFWVEPTRLAIQITSGITSMLTMIAYRFALQGFVPKVAYFTRMDRFTTGATLLVFLALAQAVMTGRLASNGRTELANKMDYFCRWLFPAATVGTIVFSFFV